MRGTHQKALPHYTTHFLRAFLLVLCITAGALSIGIMGYHFIADFGWIDSILNASMILGGMGPVGTLQSDSAKIFASCYAIFSGLVLITATGLILGPVFHRALKRFHMDDE